MPRITNWTRESRTPSLAYRNTETGARAVLHRAPDSYRYKWRAAILVDGYPLWSRGFETKQATVFGDALRDRPLPDLNCPECPNDDVLVGEKAADGAKVQRCSTVPTVATKVARRSSTALNAEATRRPAVAFFLGQERWPESNGPDLPMSLDVIDRYSEALFEFLWCPVCGHEVFSHIPFEGVFCKHCNTQVEIQESQEDRGYEEAVLVCFDSDTTWNLHVDEKLRRDLPDGSARVKILGAPGAYEIDWWSPESSGDWEPVGRGEFDDIEEPAEVSHLA